MSKSRLWAGITLLSLIVVLFAGCAGHPKGLDGPRQLTDSEKGKAIEIALGTPEAQRQLETKPHYTTEINWLAVTWNGSKWSAYYHVNSEWETDPTLKNVPDSAVFYPYAHHQSPVERSAFQSCRVFYGVFSDFFCAFYSSFSWQGAYLSLSSP